MFDAKQESQQLKKQTKAIRKRTYTQRRSSLDKWTGELVQLRRSGCSIAELQRWLKSKKITVCHSTVSRWMKRHG